MSGFKVEPIQINELGEFVDVLWSAFSPLEADMIMPMIYTKGITPELTERYKSRIMDATEGNPGEAVLCAKDRITNEIVAVMWWSFDLDPPKNQEELEKLYQEKQAKRNSMAPLEGQNTELLEAMFANAFPASYELVGLGTPHASLTILATRPKYQGKGAGTLLMKHFMEKVDRLGTAGTIIAGKQARPLYERFGYRMVKPFPLDCRKYGGRSEGKHFLMYRPPVTRS